MTSVEKAAFAEVLLMERLIAKEEDEDYRDWLLGLLARFKKFAGVR